METTEQEQPQEDASQQEEEAAQRTIAAAATDDEPEQSQQQERGKRKERVGVVASDKMDKSIVVVVQRQVKHDMYDKFMRRTSKIMAHDEDNDASEGDTVGIMESRPYSKNKRWRLTEIIERAK